MPFSMLELMEGRMEKMGPESNIRLGHLSPWRLIQVWFGFCIILIIIQVILESSLWKSSVTHGQI